jgi:hypothetical protein
MPNGGGGDLKMQALFNLSDIDRKQWHIATAHHLRFFADQIETKGFEFFHGTGPVVSGRIVNDPRFEGEFGRGICEYNER